MYYNVFVLMFIVFVRYFPSHNELLIIVCLLWAAGTDGCGFPRQPSIDISAHVSVLFVSSLVVNKILSFL